ncbi:hypothetical protein NQ317_012759 [Molorchus minor]|uniref:Protein kinase domain-containing protein n=1 Tax=Molorchus minor TaxID=1323400 RepID=A0ABQ9K4M4_9CUCU|nr:hypothetical protein NQ317_012759 [Molorchus minor]
MRLYLGYILALICPRTLLITQQNLHPLHLLHFMTPIVRRSPVSDPARKQRYGVRGEPQADAYGIREQGEGPTTQHPQEDGVSEDGAAGVSLRRRSVSVPGGVVSYSAPESSEPSQGLYDSSYDGIRSNGRLSQGVGRLVDGEVGLDNFRLDIGYGKGNGWISWRNDSFSTGYIELLFEFDQVRNFSAVYLHTNNFFSRNVQVFSKAKVMFSIGDRYYNGATLSYSYMPDRVLENARNVSINLHQRLARFVKLRLYFADSRIMLSEVVFDSVPVPFNVTEEEALDLEEKELIITSSGDKARQAFETIAAKKEGDTYVEVIIGVLTAIMLLLMMIFVIILIVNKRHKLQGSPTLLRNPFGVTINMKDLLMNLSSGTAAPSAPSRPVTPVSCHHDTSTAGDRSSMSFEQYRAPLVTGYYAPNYATLRCSSSAAEEPDESPEVPPLPDEDESSTIHQDDVAATSSSALHYRSLQSTPSISPKSKMINLGNYFPRVATDPPNRKRYHTAPREKHRLPPPAVCWNIAPSMGHAYSCREVELVPIPRYALRPIEKLGSCHAGDVTLYETERLEDIIPGVCRLVAVKTCTLERAKSEAATGSMESLREVRFLAGLSDPNVCKVLGVCTAEQPPWTVVEYGDMGDLAQYLQFLVNRNGTVHPKADQPISVGSLIFMATQIASGMKYLESKHVVHKDLAARNCLVGRGYKVKIADVAMCKLQYRKDYAEIGGRPPAPIRWLPWESILLETGRKGDIKFSVGDSITLQDRYSCPSTVWAFAVTLWEILGFCCEKPFSNLSNEKVIQNAEHMYYGGELQVLLNKPTMCSSDIYDLMCSCWKRDDKDRPSFKQIHMFLKHINKDYDATD